MTRQMMTRPIMTRQLMLPLLLAFAWPVCAQQSQPAKAAGGGQPPIQTAPPKAEIKAATAPPPGVEPSAEMKRLRELFLGNTSMTQWIVDETYADSLFMPGGGKGHGTDIMRLGPGGLSVITEYRSSGVAGPFSGWGAFAWDPDAKQFQSFWIDNTRPAASQPTGKWDGDSIVFTSTEAMNGQKFTLRQTYKDIKPDSFTVEFELGPVGGKLSPFITYSYRRGSTNMRPFGHGSDALPSSTGPTRPQTSAPVPHNKPPAAANTETKPKL